MQTIIICSFHSFHLLIPLPTARPKEPLRQLLHALGFVREARDALITPDRRRDYLGRGGGEAVLRSLGCSTRILEFDDETYFDDSDDGLAVSQVDEMTAQARPSVSSTPSSSSSSSSSATHEVK